MSRFKKIICWFTGHKWVAPFWYTRGNRRFVPIECARCGKYSFRDNVLEKNL